MNKYFWVSVLLIIASVVGIWWLMNNKEIIKISDQKREEAINAIYPTTTISPTKKTVTPTSMIVGEVGTKGGLTEEGTTQTIFESVYSPDRKLYIEKEYSGTRYVLWKADSKITLHIGNSWSWVHPRREMTETGIVPGQMVFEYNIGSQHIVDFVDNGKKYTIQCVHNGVAENKTECDKFIANFKLI